MNKICTNCKLPDKKFYKNKTTKDGLASWCKDCCKAHNIKYYLNHKDDILNATTKHYRENGKYYQEYRKFYTNDKKEVLKIKDKVRNQSPKRRYQQCKARAKRENKDFNLTFEEFIDITEKRCLYCNRFSDNDKKTFCGIDRMINDVGYIKENCAPCCDRCNLTKHTLDISEFKELIKKIYNHWVKNVF